MRKLAIALFGAVAMAGCGNPDPVSVVTSEKGLTRIAMLDVTTHALLFAAADPIVPIGSTGMVIAPTDAAAAAAAAVNSQFQPANCASATVSGASVSYQLASCNGRLGLIGINGSYTVTYAAGVDALGIAVTSPLMTVGGIPMSIDATAVYTQDQSGAARTLTINTKGTAPGDEYEILQATNSTLSWSQGVSCATESSTGVISVGGTAFVQSVSGVARCQNQCPQPSNFTLASGGATLVTVTFDGSTKAAFVTTQNPTGAIPLSCTASNR